MDNILITGITSFTGLYIANIISKSKQYNVQALLQHNYQDYTGIKKERLELSHNNIQFIEQCSLASDKLISQIELIQPSVFINHAFNTLNYRSPDYNIMSNLSDCGSNIASIIKALKNNNCKLLIHTGSIFEPKSSRDYNKTTPYGLSKKLAWNLIEYYCQVWQLPCVKLNIPNPYGYLENTDRLLPVLYKQIQNNQEFTLYNAQYIQNNIQVENLAEYYLQAVNLGQNTLPEDFVYEINPVGHIETQKSFIYRATQSEPYLLKEDKLTKYMNYK